MEVNYISACLDSSGYAEAARNNIAALDLVGVKVNVKSLTFEQKKCDLGRLGRLVTRLSKNKLTSSINIIHVTPPNYPSLVSKGFYNIGYAAWETSKLPQDWVDKINMLDEVWVPSSYNKQAFIESGIKIPITRIPHTFNAPDYKTDSPFILDNLNEDVFAFYTISQWLERKNLLGLLKAYLTEFKSDEKVALVLKTFSMRPGLPSDAEVVRKRINAIKGALYLDSYPKILLISSLLSADQIHALHEQCDCYVSLHRSEGFGIPVAESMLHKNPVIVSKHGGVTDFVKKSNGYLVNSMDTPVFGMPWEMYKGDQLWGEPDLIQARRHMRTVFKNREQAQAKGEAGYKTIKDSLSWDTVGNLMKSRLEVIAGQLDG